MKTTLPQHYYLKRYTNNCLLLLNSAYIKYTKHHSFWHNSHLNTHCTAEGIACKTFYWRFTGCFIQQSEVSLHGSIVCRIVQQILTISKTSQVPSLHVCTLTERQRTFKQLDFWMKFVIQFCSHGRTERTWGRLRCSSPLFAFSVSGTVS